MSSPRSADPRRVALLGSTGSIGRQAVDVLGAQPGAFDVVALAAGSNGPLLADQAAQLRPAVVALADEMTITALDLPVGIERDGGPDALVRLATRDDVDSPFSKPVQLRAGSLENPQLCGRCQQLYAIAPNDDPEAIERTILVRFDR